MEIKRRLKRSEKQPNALFEFYLVVFRHLSGKLRNNVAAFNEVLDKTPEDQKELLRTASRRLSSYASGPLERALNLFDFEELEHPDFSFNNHMFSFSEEADELDEIFYHMDFLTNPIIDLSNLPPGMVHEEIEEMLSFLEELINKTGLRGAPGYVIRNLREEMKKETSEPWLYDVLAPLIDKDRIDNLSREAWEFIYGEN
jgi:hypothetical protein